MVVDNFGNVVDKMIDMQCWGEEEVEDEFIKEGYFYFENVEVLVKKKKCILLMQLLNLYFSFKVKIYYDLFVKEIIFLGVGGLMMVGGDEKFYYVQFGEDIVFKLEKKYYCKCFEGFYKDCFDVVSKYGENIQWGNLVEYVIVYIKCFGF